MSASFGQKHLLQAYHRPQVFKQTHIRVYIEGDGFAYVTRSIPSPDPTPLEPTSLRLAAADDAQNVLYLARPCQYTKNRQPKCPRMYWTTHRYSRDVLDIYHMVLDSLKNENEVKSFDLVGYSGGGTIAALLAAEREDIVSLRTVASNLDVKAFLAHHGVSAMPHSLDPAELAEAIRAIPQIHFVAAEDDIIPPEVVHPFLKAQGLSPGQDDYPLVVIEGVNHAGPWDEIWTDLLGYPPR